MEAWTRRTAVVHDPHPLWIDAVRTVLTRVEVDVVASTTEEPHVLELVREHQPDLLVTAALLGESEFASGVRTIIVADSAEPGDVQAAFGAGAAAYVLKSAHPDDLATAVRQVFARTVFTLPRRTGLGAVRPGPALDVLTRREREILRLVAEGRSNSEVAQLLWVTRQTVKFHLASVFRKLGVANRTEAGAWAYTHGLLAESVPALAA